MGDPAKKLTAEELAAALDDIPISAPPPPKEPAATAAAAEPTPTFDELLARALKAFRPPPDAAVDASDRDDRKNDSLKVLDRLPEIFREPRKLVKTSPYPGLRTAAKAWQPDRNFLVVGKTGYGKSSIAAWLLRRLIHHGVRDGGDAWHFARRVQWFHAQDLERSRKEHPLGKGEAPELLAAELASVLVIDDIGQDVDPAGVSAVISARYDAGRPTIFTSNMPLKGILEHYGAATSRRITDLRGQRATVVNLLAVKR